MFVEEFKNYLYNTLNKGLDECLKAINFDENKINRDERGRFAKKLAQMAKDYKNGEYNPLKYKNETVKIDNITPSEKNYVISEITSNMSKDEIKNGFAARRLYNQKDKKDYTYSLIYDKDGNHIINKYDIGNKYD